MLVRADDSAALAAWRKAEQRSFTPAEWKEFDDMLREIRLRLSDGRTVNGAKLDEAVHHAIHQRSFRAVVLVGYEFRRDRIQREARELQDAISANAWLVTKPTSPDSAKYLTGFRERQNKRLDSLMAELEQVDRRMVALGYSAESLAGRKLPPLAEPAPVEREEALQHFATMVDEIRSAAAFKYGPWPVTVDRKGAKLSEDERTEFRRASAEAEALGEIVVPVRLKQRWWMYRGPFAAPDLPSFVVANLTEKDRHTLRQTWCELQAEVWARRSAAAESGADAQH